MPTAKLYAGTSGFAYDAWKPVFYPPNVPSKKYLEHYAKSLNAVEINYTFRRLPSPSSLQGWIDQTPAGFVFSLKAHQKLTHFIRLQKNEFTDVFFKAVDPLRIAGRLGPVLFQLPPNFSLDLAVLTSFLQDAPDDIPLAFEFRNKSWFVEPVYELLEKHGVALCLAESETLVVPERVTAKFVYFRLRKENYTTEEVAEIRAKCEALVSQGKDVFVYFKHEDTPDGALCAEQLLAAKSK